MQGEPRKQRRSTPRMVGEDQVEPDWPRRRWRLLIFCQQRILREFELLWFPFIFSTSTCEQLEITLLRPAWGGQKVEQTVTPQRPYTSSTPKTHINTPALSDAGLRPGELQGPRGSGSNLWVIASFSGFSAIAASQFFYLGAWQQAGQRRRSAVTSHLHSPSNAGG